MDIGKKLYTNGKQTLVYSFLLLWLCNSLNNPIQLVLREGHVL